jgi:hypothetical protein
MTGSTDLNASPDILQLRKMGVFDYEAFAAARRPLKTADFLIENVLRRRSRNVFVGDSGLGKTPLTVDMGVRLAAGLSWCGHSAMSPVTVLYLDGESGEGLFHEMLWRLSAHAGLSAPPRNFLFWNPTWSTTPPSTFTMERQISEIIDAAQPNIVFVDPLRVFWPRGDGEECPRLIEQTTRLTGSTGCAWMFTHHLRKRGHEGRASLEDDTHAFFQESCGALALINHTDLRIGMEPATNGAADLVVAGFVRGIGKIGPLHIVREFNDDGEPDGYRMLSGVEHLPSQYRKVFDPLPDRYRFKQVKSALGGTSSSNAVAMIRQCLALGIAKKVEDGWYEKVRPAGPDGPAQKSS